MGVSFSNRRDGVTGLGSIGLKFPIEGMPLLAVGFLSENAIGLKISIGKTYDCQHLSE